MSVEKENRRHPRIPYLCPVSISWEDAHGHTTYAHAKCLDVSEEGLRIEVSKPISVHSRISFRAERLTVSGSATVKHVARLGAKYSLGLNLSQALRSEILIAIVRDNESDED